MYCDRGGPEIPGVSVCPCVCLSVCPSVCLSVGAKTPKLVGRFYPNFEGMVPIVGLVVRVCVSAH